MKKNSLLVLLLVMIFMLVGCGKESSQVEVNSNTKNTASENTSSNKEDTHTDTAELEKEDDNQLVDDKDSQSEETDKASSGIALNYDVNEKAFITINDITITYPISWEELKKILDDNNIDYSSITSQLDRSIHLNENVYLDDEQNHFYVVLDKDSKESEEVRVTQIGVNITHGLDANKYTVKFNGKLDINSDINDAINMLGEYDLSNETPQKNSYSWRVNDTRKLQYGVSTGLNIKNPDKISTISVGIGK